MLAVALTIAGSDPSGGAGLQADLKTFHAFRVYGEAVVTLITVQNTQRVSRVETLPPDLVAQQIEAVLSDIPPLAAKTRALGNVEIVETVAHLAQSFPFPLVVDPVMLSKHGARLLSPEAEEALKRRLLPHACLVMPNIPEAEALTGRAITTEQEMRDAGHALCDLGCQAALIKGGHRQDQPTDVLVIAGVSHSFPGVRIETTNTHGTGCTLSAAITASLALGETLDAAIQHAKAYVQQAIASAPGLGQGYGPLNYFASYGPNY